ncbi:MAG TPA: hypothetical protein VHL14_06185 [Steroidobacteraceae bacterium]|nr:hypothetical protein [Steroidobacteraceae bacterium]
MTDWTFNSSVFNAPMWALWRSEIIRVIQREYGDLFSQLRQDEVDWEAWLPLYADGLSAESAVHQALSPFPS